MLNDLFVVRCARYPGKDIIRRFSSADQNFGLCGRSLAKESTSFKRSAIFLGVATFFYWASLYVYVPILPVYAQRLGASMTMVGVVLGAYGATQLILRIPLGLWSDSVGRRRPFVAAGFLGAALGAAGLALAPNAWLLSVGRGLTGVGAAAWVAIAVLFASYFAPQDVHRAIGILNFVLGLSQAFFSGVGGFIAEEWGWVAPFWVGGALGLLGLLCLVGVGEGPRLQSRPPTWALFWRVGTVPLLITASLLACVGTFTTFTTSFGFIPVYGAKINASKADLGVIITVFSLSYSVAALSAAWLAHRLGSRGIVVLGLMVLGITSMVVPLIGTVPLLTLSQLASGVGRGLQYPLLMGLSLQAVPPEERATAMGVFQAVYSLGMFAGPWLGGVLADAFGLESVFTFSGLVCLLSALGGWWMLPQRFPQGVKS